MASDRQAPEVIEIHGFRPKIPETRWVIWLPIDFAGRNEAERAARASRFAGAELKKRYTDAVQSFGLEWRPSGWIPLARYRVECVWNRTSDAMDPDNISAAIKYVLDGLVAARILAGDRWKNVDRITHDFVVSTKPGVQVFLTLTV
jgi:hypothetical protein